MLLETDDVINQTTAQGNLSRFQNAEDIEFVYPDTENNWAEARCSVQSIDSKRMRIIMQQPCHWNLYHRPWQPAKGKLALIVAGRNSFACFFAVSTVGQNPLTRH